MTQGKRGKIGLGIVTTPERKDFFRIAQVSVEHFLGEKLDVFVTYSDKDHEGVAKAKNQILNQLLDQGCDYLFVMEDDMEIIDGGVLAMYIAAHRLTNIPHFNFSQHGPNKYAEYVADLGNGVEGWPNACGALSFYTRDCLEEHGLMDENFINAYEHVEHSWRIYKGKLSYGIWPDVKNSHKYIREQEDANLKKMTPERLKAVNKAREYWFSKDPECPLIAGIL